MFLSVALYLSLSVCILGLLFRVRRWFTRGLTTADRLLPPGRRLGAVLAAVGRGLTGRGLPTLLRGLLLDVLLLRRSFQADRYRWTMHLLIFWGFSALLFMHALEDYVSVPLLPGYASTLNPYLPLRDLFGLMVLAGGGLALWRRYRRPHPRLKTRAMDLVTIGLLVLIILSGFWLKGAKIASQAEFTRMVEAYAFLDDPEEIRSLESLWVYDYGLVSPTLKGPFDPAVLAQGRELNEASCVHCHSPSQWAFVSYGASWLAAPLAGQSNGATLVALLWYLHVLACCVGLAWLPFGKLFHALTTPLSLLAGGHPREKRDPALTAVLRVLALDACTRCGACSLGCAVGVVTEALPNPLILPSEKLRALHAVAAGTPLPEEQGRPLLEGLVVCTNCNGCTTVCPAGLDLQDLWDALREELLQSLPPEPYVLSPLHVHGMLLAGARESGFVPARKVLALVAERHPLPSGDAVLDLGSQRPEAEAWTLAPINCDACFNCRTCSLSCPVATQCAHPRQELGLLPHQIVQATRMGLHELAASSRMLWACLGCYQCQEQCPQGVPVADVIYAHKQAVLADLKHGGKA